jgi:hypothetical protein
VIGVSILIINKAQNILDLNTIDSNKEISADNFKQTLNGTFECADILFSWSLEIGKKYHVVLSR